ncbi:four helix bundle protein [Candidatus Kaiserbacteria bacterium RIFCSPLOWO2_01_FULL_54_13]|uniref:Four helix bundle protein n=1 Tax=Candidatus Kaiserbacteria bacterium RIFCSPLOWO2_01_FULL_54_13 TaxID=1798512 RepID=A0A1F6F013_9BACT|nr:MAG: four helix bundle protein [Candidatus Kaiserbacteria bacterium RIFCSPLOWO2_01_FULL_54_13]
MNNDPNKKYDLEERTAVFGEAVITLCKEIKQDAITKPLINQLVRAATSIGANYMEANGASSKRDFTNKIFICKKECQETKHWLRMIASCVLNKRDETKKLWQECQELTLIFNKIASSARLKH